MSSNYLAEVESGIPLPSQHKGRRRVYPWDTMKVGDSFYTPTYISGAINGARKRLGHRYERRQEGTGYRVFRVA